MLPMTRQQPGLDFGLCGTALQTDPFGFQSMLKPIKVGSPVRIRQEKPKVEMPIALHQLAFDRSHGIVVTVELRIG